MILRRLFKTGLVFFFGGALLLGGCTSQSKKELWIYASLYKETIAEMEPLLKKAFPDIEIKWFQAGSENVAAKIGAEIAAGGAKADLVLTSDPFWYAEMKEKGHFLHYWSANAQGIPPEFTDVDQAFVGGRLPVMVIGYHSQALTPAELPKTWKDLTHPKWKNKIAMPSPLESGTAFTTTAMLSKKYGWEYFKALRKNNVLSAGGNSSVMTRLESKERVVGIVLLENILKVWNTKGSPVRPIYPEDGVIPIMSPVAILKSSKNPELAKKVYDWFFTKPAQASIVQSGMYSLMAGTPSPQNAVALKELYGKMMPWSTQVLNELYQHRDEVKKRFTEIVLK